MEQEAIVAEPKDSAQEDLKSTYLLRGAGFLAAAAVALVISSSLWPDRFLPSSKDFEDSQSFAETELRSIIPMVPESKLPLVSQVASVSEQLKSKRSLIASWDVAAIHQQVQPSPKRIVDISIDEENNETLVLRDRVVVIPKTISVSPTKFVEQKIKKKTTLAPKKVVAKLLKKPAVTKKGFKNKPFTIQLMASLNQQKLKTFVTSHKIGSVKILLTKRNGVDWYVLTMGQYSQKEQAKAAMKNLPVEISRFNPWVRPVSELKALG